MSKWAAGVITQPLDHCVCVCLYSHCDRTKSHLCPLLVLMGEQYAIAAVYRGHRAIDSIYRHMCGAELFLSINVGVYDHRRRNSRLGMFKVYLQQRNTSELAHYTMLENILSSRNSTVFPWRISPFLNSILRLRHPV